MQNTVWLSLQTRRVQSLLVILSFYFFLVKGNFGKKRGNRPFLHYAPVSKHKDMRTMLGRTISYKSLYLSTRASSQCLCLQECEKGLLVCCITWRWSVTCCIRKIGMTCCTKKKKKHFYWCKTSLLIFSSMLVTSMLYDMKVRCSSMHQVNKHHLVCQKFALPCKKSCSISLTKRVTLNAQMT